MEFHKWTEIENLESEKFKNSKSFQYASSIKEWVVTEKIDGTNFGLNITKDDWQLNSRNNLLGKMASFYNIYANQDMFLPLIEKVQSIMTVDQLTLQGEYFGSKVMNRIDYKVQYDFRIFGGYSVTDGVKSVIPFCDIVKLMTDCGFSDKIIPILGTYTRFEKAIEYPNNKPSTLNADVQMEGIVIMPYSIPYNADGYDLIFKNKNEEFNERAKRGHKAPSDIPAEEIERMKALKEMFKEYITESRMYSVQDRQANF